MVNILTNVSIMSRCISVQYVARMIREFDYHFRIYRVPRSKSAVLYACHPHKSGAPALVLESDIASLSYVSSVYKSLVRDT